MTLTDRLGEYVRVCFTGIWIESHEHLDALVDIAQLYRQEVWQRQTVQRSWSYRTSTGSCNRWSIRLLAYVLHRRRSTDRNRDSRR